MHGETDYDKQGILGGDPSLNEDGVQFSKELHEFINGRSEVRIGMNWLDRIEEYYFYLMWYESSCLSNGKTFAIWISSILWE